MIVLFFVPVDGVPCFFYAVDHITNGEVLFGENVGRHVAAAHSLFNVFNVILFTPFIGALAWLCAKLIPARAATPRAPLVNLDRHWLTSPSLALDGAVRAAAAMTERASWLASRPWSATAAARRRRSTRSSAPRKRPTQCSRRSWTTSCS